MELRTLEYFLAIAHEGNITNAAKALHVTQPTLSRQLASMEAELGCQLYTRSHKGIDLTSQGIRFQRYAESIVDLANKARDDMAPLDAQLTGVVHIGAGETCQMSIIAKAMKNVHEQHQGIMFKLSSGTTADLKDGLIKGFYDVMLECDASDHAKLNTMPLPLPDTWVIVMRTDDPLASKDAITPDDLMGRRLITSRQGIRFGALVDWFGPLQDQVDVVAEYRLPLNARFLVQQGCGIALVYQQLIESSGGNDICSRPLSPQVEAYHKLIWRNTTPNRQTQVFLDEMRSLCAQIELNPQLGRDILAGA